MTQVEACPFCDVAMIDYSFIPRVWRHPFNGCVISGKMIEGDEFLAKWNTRTPLPASPSPMGEEGRQPDAWLWEVRDNKRHAEGWADEWALFASIHKPTESEWLRNIRPLYLTAQAPTPASGGGEPESYERRRARIGCNCPRPSARACAGERVTYGFDCQCECHREPIAAEADTAKDDPQLGAWRCSQCGELRESWADPRWRWNGEQWEHQHEHLGHVAARKFGDPPAADRLAQTVTDAEVDAAYGYLMSVNQDVPHGILRCALETSLRARESAPQSTAPDEASQ